MARTDRRVFGIIYIIMMLIVAGIGIVSTVRFGNFFRVTRAEENMIPADSGWTDRYGNAVDLAHLNEIEGVNAGQSFSIFVSIPDDLEEGTHLCFRSKNILVSAYVDEECIYHSETPEEALNSKAYGTNWHYILLPKDAAGRSLEIRFVPSYDSAKAAMDTIVYGAAEEYIMTVLQDKAVAIVTCILFLFAGIMLLILDIPVNAGQVKNHELAILGMFSIMIAVWCLVATYVVQIFTGDGRTDHILSCCLLMMIPYGIILYLYESFGDRLKVLARVLLITSAVEFVLNMILQFAGIADFQQTLFLTHILLVTSALIFLVIMIIHSVKAGKDSSLFFRILRGIGLGSIGITTTIDIIRFYIGNYSDNGRFVRLGLLIFILCYGGSSLERSIDTFRMGAKAEVISRLAYQDGLTELGNRTAFDECLEQVELERQREHIEIGIAMFDVNNLKAINDMIGHQMGDQLIKTAADILRNTYGKEGSCFRVGGDEFVAIITGTQVMERCEACRKQSEAMIAEANNSKELPFYVRIASGYNVYIPGQVEHQTLKEIYRMADARMYENKKRMKHEDPNAPIVKKGETMRLKKFSGETSRLFGRTVILKADDNPAAKKESRS